MQSAPAGSPEQLQFSGKLTPEQEGILTQDAQAFLVKLTEAFSTEIEALLKDRETMQRKFDEGYRPDFLPETRNIREGDWKVAPIPEDLQDRRVEITGPVERKMTINALNSSAKVWMADFEDALTPAWDNVMDGQVNMRDAIDRTITYTNPDGKEYKLNDGKLATLVVRPRGWHLYEKHIKLHGKPIPGALVDFGLFFFHNAQKLIDHGTGPYFYLPKLENHREAALWAKVFDLAEKEFGFQTGTIKATVLIEVITAVFEMEEILYVLRDYIVGLNCGRWDYIFSYIKKFAMDPNMQLPERAQVTMTVPFLKAYSELLIQTCHKRGAFAMGGMAPQIPIKGDEKANEQALGKVKADKEREAKWGHDGTWVAHPGLIPVAMEVFDRLMPGKNQLDKQLDVSISAKDLLEPSEGTITEGGFRNNISVSLIYLANWLNGNGCVPIYNLMEDAATAEIARAQVWQWIRYDCVTEEGEPITKDYYAKVCFEEMAKIKEMLGEQFDALPFADAKAILDDIVTREDFIEFVTLPGYDKLG